MAVTPMFPLEVAMLPGEELPLRIFEPRYTQLVSDCLATDDPAFGVVLIAAGREVGGGDTRSDVGALAHITECADFGDGRYRLRCVLKERIRVLEWQPDDPYPRAAVEVWPDEPGGAVDVDAIRDVEERMVALVRTDRRGTGCRGERPRHRGGRRRLGRCRNVVVCVGFPAADRAGRSIRRAFRTIRPGAAVGVERCAGNGHRDGRVPAVG